MKWTKNNTFDPDREAIKMRWDFELIEEAACYILILNEQDYRVYDKSKYTQLKAECEAADVVNQAKEKHGKNSVYYAGIFNQLKPII